MWHFLCLLLRNRVIIGGHGLMITKRQIAAKTPYAPYAMRLILSCVALGDKKTEGWRRNGVKNQYLCRIKSICSTLQCVLRVLICRLAVLRDAESNIQEQHPRATPPLPCVFLRFWRFRSRFMLPKYMAGWRTVQLRRLN